MITGEIVSVASMMLGYSHSFEMSRKFQYTALVVLSSSEATSSDARTKKILLLADRLYDK